MKTYKTTNDDFTLFINECKKWQYTLGLTGWSISFEHKFVDGGQAKYDCVNSAMVTTITLSTKLILTDLDNPQAEIKKAAFHELMHLHLTALEYAVVNGDLAFTQKHEHEIIFALTEFIFNKKGRL